MKFGGTPKTGFDSPRLESTVRVWTEKLYELYDNIAYWHRLKLVRPVIVVERLKGSWGTFDPEKRIIKISHDLIELYPWHIVEDVLRHEMAHQIASDLLGYDRPHGPHFRRACAMLGLSGWAARASGELPTDEIPDWRTIELSDRESSLLRKVEKLLALADSANEHEALAAMKKVKELYLRHNIDKIRAKQPSEMVRLVLSHKKKRTQATETRICSILTGHYFVYAVHGSHFDAQDLQEYRIIELLGSRENVLLAEYIYNFLWDRIHVLWEGYQERSGKTGRSKRSYQLGVLAGFQDKLRSTDETFAINVSKNTGGQCETRALVKVAEDQLMKFVRFRYPRLATSSWSGGRADMDSYSAGKEDGHKINISRPISHGDGNRGRLLRD